MDVKYIGKNDKGQMRLSRRAVLLRDSPVNATGGPLLPGGTLARNTINTTNTTMESLTSSSVNTVTSMEMEEKRWKMIGTPAESAYNSKQ
jgi:hypothetical protein